MTDKRLEVLKITEAVILLDGVVNILFEYSYEANL